MVYPKRMLHAEGRRLGGGSRGSVGRTNVRVGGSEDRWANSINGDVDVVDVLGQHDRVGRAMCQKGGGITLWAEALAGSRAGAKKIWRRHWLRRRSEMARSSGTARLVAERWTWNGVV